MTLPSLSTKGSALVDPTGSIVYLRGINTEGMAGVAAFFPGGVPAYLSKFTGKDTAGNQWYPTVARLQFERYPCTDPGRLYQIGDPRIPSCIPNTNQVDAWVASTPMQPDAMCSFGGQRYIAGQRAWRADRGQDWNPGPYKPGDIVTGLNADSRHCYKCTSSTTITNPALLSQTWNKGPTGTSGAPQTDVLQNTWIYIGEWGMTGATQPFSGTLIFDGNPGATEYFDGYQDNLCQWQLIEKDLTPAQADAAWITWTTNVLDPSIQAVVAENMYAIVCMFDFGPAHHPLLSARLTDFWGRMSKGKWANHPNVIFDLWNESEPIDSFDGFNASSWIIQKPVVQSVVDMIRANGANNICMIPTPGFCAYTDAATSSPLTGTNIVYVAHHYSQFYYGSVQDWATHIPSPTGGNHLNLEAALASGQPVILSEWGPSNWTDTVQPGGVPPVDVAPFVQTLQSTIETGAKNPSVGWLAWAWTQNWSPDMFVDAADTQETPFGNAVRQWLADKATTTSPGGPVVTPPTPPTLSVLGTVTADASGKWTVPVTLASGTHTITAKSATAVSSPIVLTVP